MLVLMIYMTNYLKKMTKISNIKEHWEIRFKDVDADTGEICQDKPIAISLSEKYANYICNALTKFDYEPNRDFYTLKIETIEDRDIQKSNRTYGKSL